MISLYVGPAVLVALMIAQYIALRIRDTRATPADPHLGRKAGCYFFVNLAVTLAAIGLTISVGDLLTYAIEPAAAEQKARKSGEPSPSVDPLTGQPVVRPPFDWLSDMQRTAASLVVSGFVHGLVFFLAVRLGTNDRQFPAVRRGFAGMRLVLNFLALMAASTASIFMLFQKDGFDLNCLPLILAVAVVGGPAAVLQVVLLARSSGWRRERAEVD